MSNVNGQQFISFRTRDFNASIDINAVTKVIALPKLNYALGAPDYVIGMVNIAGTIIPVIDLAMRLNVSQPDKYTINTPILICRNSSNQMMGLIVDGVDDVMTVTEDQIQADVDRMDKRFVRGVVKRDGYLSLIIDVENIISSSS